jgi:histidine triad (HIT) family protein
MTQNGEVHTPHCPFCHTVESGVAKRIIAQDDEVYAIIPLNPVVPGHRVVIPRRHVESALTDPALTGKVMTYAAALARHADQPCNLITSAGVEATQSVFHLHIHIVPRKAGDGLKLPWTDQQKASPTARSETP